jgi:dipeptidyl aminopeptidase/acylaminoacyl peptidase
MRPFLLATAWFLAIAAPAGAQSSSHFTMDDMLAMVNVSEQDLSRDGRWLVVTRSTTRSSLSEDYSRTGDPTFIGSYARASRELLVIDTKTGATTTPVLIEAGFLSARWSPDANSLVVVLVRPGAQVAEIVVWNRVTGKTAPLTLPKGFYPDVSAPQWLPNGTEVLVTLRSWEWRKKAAEAFTHLIKGPIVRMSSKNPFMGWEELSQLGARRSVGAIDVVTGTYRELLEESKISGATASEDGARITVSRDTVSKTPYVKFNVPSGRDVKVIVPSSDRRYSAADRQAKLELERKVALTWSHDGTSYAYGKDGRVFVGSIDGGERQFAGPPPTDTTKPKTDSAGKPVADSVKARLAKENYALTAFDPEGQWLIASNSEGFWELAVPSGSKDLVVKTDTAETAAEYQFSRMTRDGKVLLFTSKARDHWEQGIYRYRPGSHQFETVVRDNHDYGSLVLSDDGSTLVYSKTEGGRPGDYYVRVGGSGERRLTTSNPKLDDPTFGHNQLVHYLDVDGRKQYGVLYYPPDYQEGKAYPTILHLYEQFFGEEFEIADRMLTGKGYVVFRPSVPTKADPGYVNESWLKGATAAANKLVEMGIADSDRLGVYGCSYGGFATSLIVTQTHRFKAAIAIAPPTDMISFYTESPRVGLRNMAFHEGHGEWQLNIAATPWEAPQKYLANSAVMGADRVTTPLLILSGGQDHNVPVGQSAELFYALRRLGKTVEWVNYTNGGHCTPHTTEEDFRDYHNQIASWFDQYLMKPASPDGR